MGFTQEIKKVTSLKSDSIFPCLWHGKAIQNVFVTPTDAIFK